MHFAPSVSIPPEHRSTACKQARRHGFTLVEVMVASVILVMVSMGTLGVILHAYRLTEETRLRDNARGVLRTFGDQFMRLQTMTKDADGTNQTRRFFNHTYNTGATSDGLVWGELCDKVGGSGSTEPLVVNLRDATGATTTATATVTREVKFVNASTGVEIATAQRDLQAAGYFISATFRAAFELRGKTLVESMTFVRLVP